ncbi:MAG TPA: malto-oligosyltrehalose synthase [Spirochaetota bacterium]|nr:malto-oligosyltrehalose synthase [Spirochaetota bacterium]HPJ42085.1 malto-oligosyltrehalose synthase [Spirochaetota bacterium]HPR36968.1 malto-oligosyltrehalose synthase [Spirochaetota bacterium]
MKVPVSTYRLQFNGEFTFRDAADILDYLYELGISDIYASPIFRAVTGSTHGYDVVDHNMLNPELGSIDNFRELRSRCRELNIGWLQDIVPNHMAFHNQNNMLNNLLEHGKNSEFRNYFDIEWNHAHESLRGRLLVPFLGKFYSETLEHGEIKIEYDGDTLYAVYYEHRFPLSLISYPVVFGEKQLSGLDLNGNGNTSMIRLLGALNQFNITASLSRRREGDYDRTLHTKRMLRELYDNEPSVETFMNRQLSQFNTPGSAEYAEKLDALLELQNYRLSFWKVAAEEINYRRFFNINGLISLRVEDEEVFAYTHRFIKELIDNGYVSGVRVDHVDGLSEPARYLERLRSVSGDSYIVVEKIINNSEELPSRWSVQGTTGYDFMNCLNSLFCDCSNERKFSRLYSAFTKHNFIYDEFIAEKKRLIIDKHMTGDIDNLAVLLKQLSGNDRFGRDITLSGLRNALVEVIAFFPVYRTYIDTDHISGTDIHFIKTSFEKARIYSPEFSFEYDFLEKCLTLEYVERMDEEKTGKLLNFIMRFQQYTGPFMAKGYEDTVLYIVNRLISLNEVGGNPGQFGMPLNRYHGFIKRRAETHPYSMNATSTHDSKRGEDVRSRINVISEIPGEWRKAVSQWSRINHSKKMKTPSGYVPDRNDEYFIYQTLLGTFPSANEDYDRYIERFREYMVKAVREAKVHTAWIKPDTDYEEKIILFIDRILLPHEGNFFLQNFIPFQRKINHYGILNSLSQLIIKAASPGVPDFYQGTELWDLHMVDPDNRRRVDYSLRKGYLKKIIDGEKSDLPGLIEELWKNRDNGCIKLFLTRRLLKTRNSMQQLFTEGEYIPIRTGGIHKESVVAFMRVYRDKAVIVAAPRFLTRVSGEGENPVGEVWGDTVLRLPVSRCYKMKDSITDRELNLSGEVPVSELVNLFPGVLLTGITEGA